MSTFRRHSQVAIAAYHDLVSLLLDEKVSEMVGQPMRRERSGRGYWYDRFRLGNQMTEVYLGEDTAVLRDKISRHQAIKAEISSAQKERARLVRLLRSERFRGLEASFGSLVAALAKVGVFRLGGVLVGTTAFRLYEGELGIRLGLDEVAMTADIDIASFERLSLALEETISQPIEDVLKPFSFDPVPSIGNQSVWRWRQATDKTMLEFLTPSFGEDESIRNLQALGVSAQSLHYLNYLIADPISAAAVYRDGVLVHIPRPERYAIHKLIVSDRRVHGPDSLKARKDLLQSELLIQVLAEDRPSDLKEAYEDAMSRGPRWRQRLEASIARSSRIGEILQATA
ncbi:MAG TPA: GSU2403 family nucleotidyltransferase fold protein [Dongiaceae bacterium]|nr:GSU2403 family nucleotidyltransferase fold protein [Dongiaceae bacterium]